MALYEYEEVLVDTWSPARRVWHRFRQIALTATIMFALWMLAPWLAALVDTQFETSLFPMIKPWHTATINTLQEFWLWLVSLI